MDSDSFCCVIIRACSFRELWFWKAVAITVVVHSILLFILLPFLVKQTFFLVFVPIIGEMFVFFLLFARLDPKHGEDWQ